MTWGGHIRAKSIDFMLSPTRDQQAAYRFLRKAVGQHGLPEKVTIDKSGANEAALSLLNGYLMLAGLWPALWVESRQIKYLK